MKACILFLSVAILALAAAGALIGIFPLWITGGICCAAAATGLAPFF